MSTHYDVVVIGSGPGGQRAAIQAAKLRKSVLVVERHRRIGGACVNNGTIPSKTVREAILYLTGYRERDVYGESYQVKPRIEMTDLLFRCDYVCQREVDVLTDQLHRNGIELVWATASFLDPRRLRLAHNDGGQRDVTADKIVIATGTTSFQPPNVPFDADKVFVPDTLLGLKTVPRTMVVVGGGVIGLEYASMFAALDVRVTVIEQRPRLLDFVDQEIVDDLVYHLRSRRVVLRLGERVDDVDILPDGQVSVSLASGKKVLADTALYSAGRQGATADLNLPAAGLDADARGRIAVNERYETTAPGIYAVGDVIGFPSLASTSREQGRIAMGYAFGVPVNSRPDHFPYGIYAIPEIAFVGQTEQQLTEANIPFEAGTATFKEITRGEILGDITGRLKLLFHREHRTLLGVHIIGDGAAELVHVGQAVLTLGGTIDYFVDAVFNYPTLSEAYKIAAFDGLSRIGRFW